MMFVTFSSLFSFGEVKPPKIDIPHLDKAIHFTFYFVACITGVFFLRERYKGSMNFRKALLVMVVFTVVYGIIIEVLQYTMTENREGDFLDAMANALGGFCGAIATKWYFSTQRGLKWKY